MTELPAPNDHPWPPPQWPPPQWPPAAPPVPPPSVRPPAAAYCVPPGGWDPPLQHRPGPGLLVGLVGLLLMFLSVTALPWISGWTPRSPGQVAT